MILPCNCVSNYQDRVYGSGMRVHNQMNDAGSTKMYRCTVCQAERAKKGAEKVNVTEKSSK